MDRPILFSDPMVRAILDGRKTQTRRLVAEAPNDAVSAEMLPAIWAGERLHYPIRAGFYMADMRGRGTIRCPYDCERLWVREAWKVGAWRDDGRIAIDYRASPESVRTPWLRPPADDFVRIRDQSRVDCEAANAERNEDDDGWRWEHGKSPCRWRPSIHMPRWASRITLDVTEVRVQRLQAISEEDAMAEGVDWAAPQFLEPSPDEDREDPREVGYPPAGASFARDNFRRLWDHINADRAPWSMNPWVWAVSFRRVTP